MRRIIHSSYKAFAVVICIVLLLTSLPLTLGGFMGKQKGDADAAGANDQKTASEISNMTGVSIEEVMRLKNGGRSWNEVLSALKDTYYIGSGSEKAKREELLLKAGLEEELVNSLKKEGFSDEDITYAKMLYDRVEFQLQQIEWNAEGSAAINGTTGEPDKAYRDNGAYRELAAKMDKSAAIRSMLRLKEDMKSIEAAFDEYLSSLQLDIDINERIMDKNSYLDKKDQKLFLLGAENIITISKIEEKALLQIQRGNSTASDFKQAGTDADGGPAAGKDSLSGTSPLPDMPDISAKDLRPKNPTDEIMEEIRQISPISPVNN
ncbi:hypothetical protein DFR58_10434 [Anaerobacterium chartisolvens]|uniref:Uncharacterized protein n=1 Tax=Anaerobacterium chartisolvens TaxID=1297424 RepID=A0A369BBP0_9FIRM|nr:hypothetical protein [Anaerobacterium chartisolvens]RCX18765.1 hypothetical protein DFR58_10434 [Anaerobacterium chartisolvens]